MNFEQAQQQFAELRRQRQSGAINDAQFAAAAAQLRVQLEGRWWQIDPNSGQWLFWDGAAWKPASPPSAVLAPSIVPQGKGSGTPASGHAPGTAGVPPATGDGSGRDGRAPGTAGVPPATGDSSGRDGRAPGTAGVPPATGDGSGRDGRAPGTAGVPPATGDGSGRDGRAPGTAGVPPATGDGSGRDGRAPGTPGAQPARPVAKAAAGMAVGAGMRLAAGAAPGAIGKQVAGQVFRQFLNETKKKTPLAKRSQAWWDILAILGGLISGYLWFVYSSVRGLPTPTFLGAGWGRTLFGFVPAFGLLLIPIVMIIFRRAISKFWESLGIKYPPIVRKLLLSLPLVIAAMLYLWSCVDPWIYPKLFTASREPLDIITPFLIMGMPLLFVWFREPIDAVLRPFQPIRQAIPRPILIGAGLLTPFAMAYILYKLGPYTPFPGLFTMFPYMRISCVTSTLLSYVILRTPVAKLPGGGREMAGLAGQAMRAMPTLLLLTGLGILLYHGGAWADDFLRDPFNLNDGLRTPGWAPVIAGTATSVVTVLVNGAEVVRVIIVDPNPDPNAEGPAPQSNFQVIVDTVGSAGGMSTELVQGNNETIYIYAHCTKEGAPFPQGDPTITFAANFDQTFAKMTDMGTQNGRRCASVALVLPAPQGTPPKSITVIVGAGQAVPSIPVTLSLQVSPYYLELS